MEKIYRNALICEKLTKLTKEEKHKAVIKLLKKNTLKKLSISTGIPETTLHDWKSLKNDDRGLDRYVNLNSIYRVLNKTNVEDISDWGRLEQIKKRIDELLRNRK